MHSNTSQLHIQHDLSEYVNPAQASKRLGVHDSTLRRWAKAGLIDFILTAKGQHRYNIEKYLKQLHRQNEIN